MENKEKRYWLAKTRHKIVINGKVFSRHNHEERILMVVADSQAEAEAKILEEATAYGLPYLNPYKQPVSWEFDCLLEIREIEWFDPDKLAEGIPIEIYYKRITRHKKP